MPPLTIPEAFDVALRHHQAGRLSDAEALYRQVLAAEPTHVRALHYLGLIAHQVGRDDLAVELIGQAIRLEPESAAAHANLGKAYRTLGRLDDAVRSYRRALQLEPDNPQIHNNLGVALAEQGQFVEAEAACRKALQIQPDFVDPHYNLGNMFRKQGRLDEAMAAYRRALEIQPHYSKASINLGIALIASGRLDEAITTCQRALQISPAEPELHNNLAIALGRSDRLEEAGDACRRALQLRPGFVEALNNLGNLHKARARFDEAEETYRRAIAGLPDYADARLNLGLLLLLLGRYEQGWREYEGRLRAPAYAHLWRRFSAPQWDGTPVPGKTILVHAEQGLGDVLLFTRYLPLVRARSQAARVILECQPALAPLLEQLRGEGIEITARADSDSALPPFDLHLPMLSLPLALQRSSPIPPPTPGLQADARLRAKWRERLGADGRLRVGLVWAGNPSQEDDRRRSLTPGKLAPLLAVPGIHFVSLQVEPRGPLPPAPAAAVVSDFTAEIVDFADSAALMAELDLIITVDTAAAHLGGALGRPTWVLLSLVPYWPYGLKGEGTPWYPTMRLFRQSTAGSWEEVLDRVAAALRDRKV